MLLFQSKLKILLRKYKEIKQCNECNIAVGMELFIYGCTDLTARALLGVARRVGSPRQRQGGSVKGVVVVNRPEGA